MTGHAEVYFSIINAYFTPQQTGCLFFAYGYNGARA